MKQLLCLTLALFCTTTSTAARKRTPNNPQATAPVVIPAPTVQHKAPTELHVLFEYSIADALYGICMAKDKTGWAECATIGFIKGIAKMVVVKTFLDDKYYKTAIAAHLLMQNFTLVKNALNDPCDHENLAHHMIVRTFLPVAFWRLRTILNSQKIKWVF